MFHNCHGSVTDTMSLIPTESIHLLSTYSHIIYDMSVFSRKYLLSSCRSPAYSLYQITICTTNLSPHTPCTFVSVSLHHICCTAPDIHTLLTSPTWRPEYDPFIPYSPNGFGLPISTHFRAYSPSRNHSYKLHRTTSPWSDYS